MSHFKLILFLLSLLLSLSSISSELVYDIDGDAVHSGAAYYAMPVSRGRGGGLSIAAIQDHNTRCPYFIIVQSRDDLCGSYFGLPIKFFPADSKEGNITLSTDFTINFLSYAPRAPPYCDQPTTTWKMASRNDSDDIAVELEMVPFGGLKRDGGGGGDDNDDDDESSLFKIVKNKAYGYRIRYCPKDSNSSSLKEVVCGDLAPVYDRGHGVRLLSLVDKSKRPFEIMFKKA